MTDPLMLTVAITWSTLDVWIIVIAVLAAVSCALLGNFLILRQMSMMGDAISHAVLPGIALAWSRTGQRSSVVMFIGAAVAGVLTALLTQWVNRFGQVDRGASMGVVFTALFALGLLLLVQGAHNVDLDVDCVLYGAIELAAIDTWQVPGLGEAASAVSSAPDAPAGSGGAGILSRAESAAANSRGVAGWEIPRAVFVLAGILLLNSVIVLALFKELKITSFDPQLATSLGINATVMHYLLMVLVALTTVAAFEAIGAILVIAMLIVPGAAAHLLTERLRPMIGVSLLFAAISAVIGHGAARVVPVWMGFDTGTVTAGGMATVAGLMFVHVWMIAPRHGLLSRWWTRFGLSLRILREDALGILYRMEEYQAGTTSPSAVSVLRESMSAGPLAARLAVRSLQREGLVDRRDQRDELTETGREAARRIVRSHRLWETYLADHFNLPTDHLHHPAERLEHITDEQLRRQLNDATYHATADPMGKAIPGETDPGRQDRSDP